jgi:uncharacterized RDD family membrane protein YckC
VTRDYVLKPATFFQRFVAYIADSLILLIVWLVLQTLFGLNVEEGGRGIAAINLFISTVYFTYFHAKDGATPGKKLMEIRVISIDGNALSLLQAFLRYTPYCVFIGVQIFMVISPDDAQLDPATQLLFVLLLVWHISSVYLIINSENGRTIHDFIAYTQVIQTAAIRG